jgi:outer membrane protein OmpA-like peptidoglycan-associated protein
VGIAQVAIVNNTVAVTPTSGYSGKTSVVVQVTNDNEVTTVKVPVTVLPLAPIKPILDPVSTEATKVDWNASPNAIGYQVFVDGKIACVTNSAQTECSVPQLLGPKADVQVLSRGGSLLKSDPVPAVYTNKDPITAGLVNFANNSYVLTASEKTKLRELASIIKTQGFTHIEVSGHTDPNTGVNNQVLSENRAKATVAYLQKLVPKLEVKVAGYAATQRTSSEKNDVVYAADRRAEIKVW